MLIEFLFHLKVRIKSRLVSQLSYQSHKMTLCFYVGKGNLCVLVLDLY